MLKQMLLVALMSFMTITRAGAYSPELKPMVTPMEEVEAMLNDGTFTDGEFSLNVSNQDAANFAATIKKKLRTAKAEYIRMPRAVRTSKDADTQWYRMDALLKTTKGFPAALKRHARALAHQSAPTVSTPKTPMNDAQAKAAERKREADAHAAAVRAQQEKTRATAEAVKAEKAAAKAAKTTGPNWQNSYIPNLAELKSRDGFFQWPWSEPSWKAVTDKADEEQQKGALGPTQVAQFERFIIDRSDTWPAVPRIGDAGDVQYALDMIRKRESSDGLNVVDLWISRGNWKIQRNSLGVILSRTKPGYLLYKDPSGQGCILKQFWIKEPYAGGSRYERTSGWRYAKIRFQSCDRR